MPSQGKGQHEVDHPSNATAHEPGRPLLSILAFVVSAMLINCTDPCSPPHTGSGAPIDVAASIPALSHAQNSRTQHPSPYEPHVAFESEDDNDEPESHEGPTDSVKPQDGTASPCCKPRQSPNTSPAPDRPNRHPRVHFRSRVRITSGLRHRRLSDGLASSASSISGSPSSSISAPLRSHTTVSAKGWGPLGQRVSLLTAQHHAPDTNSPLAPGNHRHDDRRRHRRRHKVDPQLDADEHTRLIPSSQRHLYTEEDIEDDEDEERRWRAQVIDEVFGTWPGRLLNRHWWWWQLEPIVCCICIDCSEVEE
ncbi:hypothetical protein BV22DRAFT_1046234 [Leucogyrophana mollusca]|uniref:Uncharacterized protein n=1 Tax=Leucogyrophana mollusca TaxID=85980 RepID=A0ACB8BKT5_9AGAM|nr:hypothetical protein BV22DRAFT_1046234 [Leucogyrophana mollusca]